MEQIFLNFDDHPQAVIEPNHEKLPFHFHSKLIYAFVPLEIIEQFLEKVDHQIIGYFDSVSFNPFIYEIVINHQKLTLCQGAGGNPAFRLVNCLRRSKSVSDWKCRSAC